MKIKICFHQEFKSISLVELKPENLTGIKEFDENFFKQLDIIENKILDGKKL